MPWGGCCPDSQGHTRFARRPRPVGPAQVAPPHSRCSPPGGARDHPGRRRQGPAERRACVEQHPSREEVRPGPLGRDEAGAPACRGLAAQGGRPQTPARSGRGCRLHSRDLLPAVTPVPTRSSPRAFAGWEGPAPPRALGLPATPVRPGTRPQATHAHAHSLTCPWGAVAARTAHADRQAAGLRARPSEAPAHLCPWPPAPASRHLCGPCLGVPCPHCPRGGWLLPCAHAQHGPVQTVPTQLLRQPGPVSSPWGAPAALPSPSAPGSHVVQLRQGGFRNVVFSEGSRGGRPWAPLASWPFPVPRPPARPRPVPRTQGQVPQAPTAAVTCSGRPSTRPRRLPQPGRPSAQRAALGWCRRGAPLVSGTSFVAFASQSRSRNAPGAREHEAGDREPRPSTTGPLGAQGGGGTFSPPARPAHGARSTGRHRPLGTCSDSSGGRCTRLLGSQAWSGLPGRAQVPPLQLSGSVP